MPDIKAIRRINGLDTLRACAILLVLMTHYSVVVSGKSTFGFLTDIGWMGVDLFFVLSGYLIGNQIMAPLACGERFSLKTFFARRLLRTVPGYYVVLAAYFLFPSALAGKSTASIWQFLTFTQNIGLNFGATFSHSWSLCIEEQFYLVLPVAALLLARLRKPLFWAWTAILAAILGGMSARGLAWLNHGQNLMEAPDFAARVYYSTFARFDELLPGVAIAMLKNFHGDLYGKIIRKDKWLLGCGAAGFALMGWLFLHYQEIKGYGYTFTMMTFGYPMLAASFALLTMSAINPESPLNRFRIPGAEKLALWSYAIYLAHKPIYKVLVAPLRGWNIDTDRPIGIAIIIATAILGGWLLYRLVETPFMQLRARWFPSGRSALPGTAADGVALSPSVRY